MSQLAASPSGAAEVLRLARSDRQAASKALAALSVEAQLAVVCGAPAAHRRELLDLLPEPERVIPLLPDAELCFTVKAVGLESATWVLEHATPEQVVSSIDLDAWSGNAPLPQKLDDWLDALAETSDEALLRSLTRLDAELVVQWLADRIVVFQKPAGDEDWEPPPGTQTLEGQFYFAPARDGDDAAAIVRALHVLFRGDYWCYFRLLQGVIHELPTDNQEWALRWRNARLQDLGFPPWEEAMHLYQHLREAERGRLPDEARPLDVAAWKLPVWLPQLPEPADGARRVFRAIALLDDEERTAAFYAFVAVANKVAVADRMELSDTETTPRAIDKAAKFIDRGLDHLAREHDLADAEVLRRVTLEHLFRLGANLEPEVARPPGPEEEVDA